MTIRKLDDHTLVCGQVFPEEIAGFAAQGVTTLVNNRPDGEDAGQPLAMHIKAAAEAAGIAYRHIPVQRLGPAEIEAMAEALGEAGDGKLLAFCRSGTRSALAWALARRSCGRPAEEVTRCVRDAGFDPAPIAHLL